MEKNEKTIEELYKDLMESKLKKMFLLGWLSGIFTFLFIQSLIWVFT
jgi:hypothetical protein